MVTERLPGSLVDRLFLNPDRRSSVVKWLQQLLEFRVISRVQLLEPDQGCIVVLFPGKLFLQVVIDFPTAQQEAGDVSRLCLAIHQEGTEGVEFKVGQW